MVLILRPSDNKVLSISRKKVYCHELMYAKFDPDLQQRPQIDFRDFTLSEKEVDEAIQSAIRNDKKSIEPDEDMVVPEHVLSVKVLSDSKRNQGFLTPQQLEIPNEMKVQYLDINDSGECKSFNVPECKSFNVPDELKFHGEDRFLEDIERMPVTESFLNSIRRVDDKIQAGELSRGGVKREAMLKPKQIDPDNIISSKRQRKIAVKKVSEGKINTKPSKKVVIKARVTVPTLKADDRVKIRTECFGKEYAVGRERYTYGRVVKVNGKIVDVQWDNAKGGGGVQMDAHLSQLKRVNPILMILKHLSKNDGGWGGPLKTVETMLPVLEVGSVLAESDPNASGNWPKDFVEAMIRPDWRSWVDAVKSENDSWDTFEACVEIPYDEIQIGASVIPLGELFTIKRSGKYKFRQIALGNMLKQGKDYGETFASTVSGADFGGFAVLPLPVAKM